MEKWENVQEMLLILSIFIFLYSCNYIYTHVCLSLYQAERETAYE